MSNLYSMSATPDPKTILRIDDVLRRTGLKRTMLYDLVRKEKFPKQVSLGARAVGWYEEQVEDWIRNRSAAGNKQSWREQDLDSDSQPVPPVSSGHPGSEDPKMERPCVRPSRKALLPLESCSAEVGDPGYANRNRVAPHSEGSFIGRDELLHLRDENARLKRLVADLILTNDLLESPIRK
jgi:prophage regulatory protein